MSDLIHKIQTTLCKLLCRELYVHLTMSHYFLGGQNYNKFGGNVMKSHSLERQRTSHKVKRHDLLCVGCNVMTNYVKVLKWCVSLRRMLVCCRELYVSQEFPIISILDRGGDAGAAFLLLRHALMTHSEVELWTAEMSFQYNVRLMNSIHLWTFGYWMNSFIKTFILLMKRDVITSTVTDETFFVIRPSSSSFATWSTNIHHLFTRFVEDFHIQTTAETLNRV